MMRLGLYQWMQSLQWRHNEHGSVSNHQPHDCLLNLFFRRISKKTSKLRVTGLFAWNSPGTGEFLAQMASNAENVSIWWRHHVNYKWTQWSVVPITQGQKNQWYCVCQGWCYILLKYSDTFLYLVAYCCTYSTWNLCLCWIRPLRNVYRMFWS